MLQLQNQECGSVVDKTLAWHSQGPRFNSQDYKRKKVEGGEQRGGERRSKEKSKKEKWKKKTQFHITQINKHFYQLTIDLNKK